MGSRIYDVGSGSTGCHHDVRAASRVQLVAGSEHVAACLGETLYLHDEVDDCLASVNHTTRVRKGRCH